MSFQIRRIRKQDHVMDTVFEGLDFYYLSTSKVVILLVGAKGFGSRLIISRECLVYSQRQVFIIPQVDGYSASTLVLCLMESYDFMFAFEHFHTFCRTR